jgi:4-aminobutyrate aminotransferase/(S)-3-amino-2-methylpropionate transaminase
VSAETDTLLSRRRNAVPAGPFNIAPLFVSRASGAKLWDSEGRAFVDFCGGIGALNVGHCHPRVVGAIREQAARYLHVCFHVSMYEEYVRLAERLNDLVPISGACKSAFFNSGAEAVENAVKIARSHTGRTAVVAFERGFHGRTLMGMSLTGKCKPYSAGLGPFAPEVYRLPFAPFFGEAGAPEAEVRAECEAALARLGAYHTEPESIACIVVEPVLGEGGFHPIRQAAYQCLRDHCTKHGIVLVADEVQSGFARCGAWFASQRYGVEPDLVTMAKSMAGGMVLSGVTGRAEIMEAPGVGAIGGTYGGNPLACVAAEAAIAVIEEEGLCERANTIGARVMERFAGWAKRYGHVGDVRGLGAMCGLDIVDPASGAPDPARAAAVCTKAFAEGLLVMTASGNVIRTLMPLVIDDADLEAGLDILESAIAKGNA